MSTRVDPILHYSYDPRCDLEVQLGLRRLPVGGEICGIHLDGYLLRCKLEVPGFYTLNQSYQVRFAGAVGVFNPHRCFVVDDRGQRRFFKDTDHDFWRYFDIIWPDSVC